MYIHGAKYNRYELTLTRFTYLFSFLLFGIKIMSAVSLWIHYTKAINQKDKKQPVQDKSPSFIRPSNSMV
jgi:hypothetical protein